MSFTTVYPINISSPAQITREDYNDVGASAITLGSISRGFLGSTDLEIWDSKTAGTQLTEGVDYTLGGANTYYSALATPDTVYTTVTIDNVAYQTGSIFITYKTIGSFTSSDWYNTIQEAGSGLYRNPIINSRKLINQRLNYTSTPAAILTNVYNVDRYKSSINGVTATLEIISTNQPTELVNSNSSKYTATSTANGSIGDSQPVYSGNYADFLGVETQSGCWVKSNSVNARLLAYDGSSYTSSAPHSGGGTWEHLRVPFTPISGMKFFPMIISATGTTVSITSGDYIETTGLSANKGPVLFPLQPLDINLDEWMCEPYYSKGYNLFAAPAAITNIGIFLFTAVSASHVGCLKLSHRMISSPTVIFYSPTTGATGVVRDFTAAGDITCTAGTIGETTFSIELAGAGSGNTIGGHWTAESEIA